MQKIARGTWGASSVTVSSANAPPPAGVRSPERSRSRTVVPSSNATTVSSRTSAARGRGSSLVVKVASFMRRRTLPGETPQRLVDDGVALGGVGGRPPPARARLDRESRVGVVLDVVALDRDGHDGLGGLHRVLDHGRAPGGGEGEVGGREDGERTGRVLAEARERLARDGEGGAHARRARANRGRDRERVRGGGGGGGHA